MSATPKDGGPAFPVENWRNPDTGSIRPFYGMSLRDYFAGQALVAIINKHERLNTRSDHEPIRRAAYQYMAQTSYDYADAMLAARERKEGN